MERDNIQMTGRAAILPLNEDEFENAVRAEEIPRTYNKACVICTTMIGAAIFIFLFFLLLSNYAWDWGRLHIQHVGIRSIHADINITNHTLVTIRANGSLLPTFRASGDINHPMLGDLTMGIRGKRYQNIRILCKSTFKTIGGEELVMVTCEPTQFRLRKEDVMMLKKIIREENLWMQVTGSFKWHLQNRNPLIWKQTNGRARFVCRLPYRDLLSGECSPL